MAAVVRRRPAAGAFSAVLLAGSLAAGAALAPRAVLAQDATLTVRNNHALPYRGPVQLVDVGLPDGVYRAEGGVA
ncbi:MAG TPA: hypothetical protein VFS08_21395, partial [Gemmatimonadaceae bacterium]|nr:hypothetical protein [Gemmatimonadaceae bacterium]